MISKLSQDVIQNQNSVENFSWEELEKEQSRIKRKGNFKNLNLFDLGFKKEDIQKYESTFSRLLSVPIKNSIVEAKVISVNNETAVLDIGYREEAYLDLSKENTSYLQYIVPGNKIPVKILSTTERGFISASYTQAAYKFKHDEIYNSIGKKVAYHGKVVKLVPGGYLVLIDEVETFMPGSLAGANKLHDFEILLGRTLPVMAVNFERGNIVVSHREYLHTLIPGKIEELKENLKAKISGIVTGTTEYGVFCEFNECLTGMISVTDLDQVTKDQFEKNLIKPGQNIEFYVKEIVSNKKIILTQNLKQDPWDNIEEKYKIPAKVKGKIVSIKEYGVFVEIEPGISGLLHRSEFEGKEFKEGLIVNIKINRIDISTKKIYLSLN